MTKLDDHLDDFLTGRAKPKSAAERVSLAWLCACKHLYVASVRWWVGAFAAQPDLANDLASAHRNNAACAAAMAGCGKGKDAGKLTGAEQRRLRQQALAWLRADLDAYREALDKPGQIAGMSVGQKLAHWLGDSDLAGVRSPQELARLPEAERHQWEEFWRDYEVLQRLAARKPDAASTAGH